jgi:hypothetical protein
MTTFTTQDREDAERKPMNANELADLLDFDAKTLNWKAFADAATMLRQQQAEIKALKLASIQTIGTLKWSEDLLRETGHTEAVSDIQDCIVAIRLALRKAQEK